MKPDVKEFKSYSLIEFDDGEQAICEVRKHWFGLLMIYIIGLVVAVAVMLLGIFLSLWLENNYHASQANNLSKAVLIIGAVLTAIVLLISVVFAYVFRNNVMLVTSDKIAQVLYRNPFDRKISQLNISDVQDVTVRQIGVFARMFDYGTLVIETAGEQQNYTFTFATKPHFCAKEIISAREKSISKFGN